MSALPILGYHNVAMAPKDAPFKLLYVSPDRFDRQLWALRRLGLRGVSTGEGIARLNNGTSRGYVVITFDDGYADTLDAAAAKAEVEKIAREVLTNSVIEEFTFQLEDN